MNLNIDDFISGIKRQAVLPSDEGVSPTVNREAIQQWFDVVYGDIDGGFINLASFSEKGGPKYSPINAWIPNDERAVDAIVSFSQMAYDKGTAAYAGLSTADGDYSDDKKQGLSVELCQETQVIRADYDNCDIAAVKEALGSMQHKPTLVVKSGGRNEQGQDKVHVYWKLEEPIPASEISATEALIADKLGGDPSFKSEAQVIRIPGSVHQKHGVKTPVQIVEYNDTFGHNPEELHGDFEATASRFAGRFIERATTANKKVPLSTTLTTVTPEGGSGEQTRFQALSQVIGHEVKTFHSGHQTQEAALNSVIGYNRLKIEPSFEESKVRREFFAILAKHTKEHGEAIAFVTPEQRQAAKSKFNPFGKRRLPEGEFITPRPWLLTDEIIKRNITFYVGPPGSGKSTYSILVGASIALGKSDWVGIKAGKAHKVWFINNEDDDDEMIRRIVAMCRHYDIPHDKLTESFFFDGRDSGGLKLVERADNGRALRFTDDIESVKAFIKENKIEVIMLDPMVSFSEGDENAAGEMEVFMDAARGIAVECDIAVVLVGHTSQMASGSKHIHDMFAVRGSTSSTGAARVMKNIMPMDKDTAEQLGFNVQPDPETQAPGDWVNYMAVGHAKGNFSAIRNSTRWFKKVSVCLNNGYKDSPPDYVGVCEYVPNIIEAADAQRPAYVKTPDERVQEDREFYANAICEAFSASGKNKRLTLSEACLLMAESSPDNLNFTAPISPETGKRKVPDAMRDTLERLFSIEPFEWASESTGEVLTITFEKTLTRGNSRGKKHLVLS